jgi:hypothetical protein
VKRQNHAGTELNVRYKNTIISKPDQPCIKAGAAVPLDQVHLARVIKLLALSSNKARKEPTRQQAPAGEKLQTSWATSWATQ